MRGNLAPPPCALSHPGSIPAYAGEPWRCRWRRSRIRVYPRVCGGTYAIQQRQGRTGGLSPRMRGNLDTLWQRTHNRRSIPAYAGEPGRPAQNPAIRGVYPRVCGGTLTVFADNDGSPGLSPRMRGNQCPCRYWRIRRRSIPAYAGEPSVVKPAYSVCSVYPRVCGGTPP